MQHGAQAADFLAVPIELFVGADIHVADVGAEHVLQRRVVANAPFGQVIGNVIDFLRAQVMQHHFGVGEEQRGDCIGNRAEIL